MEEKKNLWSSYDEAAKKELHEINEKYKACLDAGKTERECVKLAVEMAKEAGYQDIKDVLKEGKSLRDQLHFKEYLAQHSVTPSYSFRDHLRKIGGAIEQ